MAKKFKLKVIFGEKASEYAAEHSYSAAKRAISKGTIEGVAEEYEFDTEKDLKTAIQMLEDSDGWMGNHWEIHRPSK